MVEPILNDFLWAHQQVNFRIIFQLRCCQIRIKPKLSNKLRLGAEKIRSGLSQKLRFGGGELVIIPPAFIYNELLCWPLIYN